MAAHEKTDPQGQPRLGHGSSTARRRVAVTQALPAPDPDLWRGGTPHWRILCPENGCWERRVEGTPWQIGRAPEAHCCFASASVSREHALVERRDGSYLLSDCDSTTGTWLNDQQLEPYHPALLRHGATVRIARLTLQWRRDEPIIRRDGPMSFSRLPSTVTVRLRTLQRKPNEIFDFGDTLLVGMHKGGIQLLLPQRLPSDRVIEIEMAGRGCLAEVLMQIDQDGGSVIACMKMHRIDWHTQQAIIADSRRDPWLSALQDE